MSISSDTPKYDPLHHTHHTPITPKTSHKPDNNSLDGTPPQGRSSSRLITTTKNVRQVTGSVIARELKQKIRSLTVGLTLEALASRQQYGNIALTYFDTNLSEYASIVNDTPENILAIMNQMKREANNLIKENNNGKPSYLGNIKSGESHRMGTPSQSDQAPPHHNINGKTYAIDPTKCSNVEPKDLEAIKEFLDFHCSVLEKNPERIQPKKSERSVKTEKDGSSRQVRRRSDSPKTAHENAESSEKDDRFAHQKETSQLNRQAERRLYIAAGQEEAARKEASNERFFEKIITKIENRDIDTTA